MATEIDEHAVILEAPYTNLPDVARLTYFFVPVQWLMKDHFRNRRTIIHTINSRPYDHTHWRTRQRYSGRAGAKACFDQAKEPKTIIKIPEASHNDLYNIEAPLHILDFLSTIKPEED